MDTELTIEMAPFSVASGITDSALLAASERLEREFLSKADGYMGRVLARQESGKWADIVFWKSDAHASKAMEAVASSDACRSYFECMKEADHSDPHNGVSLFHAVRAYGPLNL
jgi:hypothetical protein